MIERLPLRGEADVATASRRARELARAAGLEAVEAVGMATAVSEIGTNVLVHASGTGEVVFETVDEPSRRGVRCAVLDRGPGIPDVERALVDGFSTRGGLGLGLPGARRLMDDFAVTARSGGGTEVRMAKWSRRPAVDDRPALCEWEVATTGDPAARALLVPVRFGFLAAALAATGPPAAAARTAGAAEALVRGGPEASPVVLAERCAAATAPGTRLALALATFTALDGRLIWLATGGAAATIAHVHGDDRRAPSLRAATVPVSRGDVVALAAPAGPSPPVAAGAPAEVAAAALRWSGAARAAAVGVRLLRGKEERRGW